MVYHLTKYGLKIICTHIDQRNPAVVVTLGSEARTFQLEGFINFWLDMVKVGRKAVDAHLTLTRSTNSNGRDRRPTACSLKRHGLKITFSRLNCVKPEVSVALGSEVRTLQLQEFIAFWWGMIDLLPNAPYLDVAYSKQCTRQTRRSSRGERPSRERVSERVNAQEPAPLEAHAGSVKARNGPVWSISPDVLATYSEEGALVVNVPREICYSLNNAASRIWLAMESSPSGITLEGIVEVLEETFEIPREQLARDASEFLENLQEISLVNCEGHHISREIRARSE